MKKSPNLVSVLTSVFIISLITGCASYTSMYNSTADSQEGEFWDDFESFCLDKTSVALGKEKTLFTTTRGYGSEHYVIPLTSEEKSRDFELKISKMNKSKFNGFNEDKFLPIPPFMNSHRMFVFPKELPREREVRKTYFKKLTTAKWASNYSVHCNASYKGLSLGFLDRGKREDLVAEFIKRYSPRLITAFQTGWERDAVLFAMKDNKSFVKISFSVKRADGTGRPVQITLRTFTDELPLTAEKLQGKKDVFPLTSYGYKVFEERFHWLGAYSNRQGQRKEAKSRRIWKDLEKNASQDMTTGKMVYTPDSDYIGAGLKDAFSSAKKGHAQILKNSYAAKYGSQGFSSPPSREATAHTKSTPYYKSFIAADTSKKVVSEPAKIENTKAKEDKVTKLKTMPAKKSAEVMAQVMDTKTQRIIKTGVLQGNTGTGYTDRELARKLSVDDAENKASELCEGANKAKVEFLDNGCDKNGNEYKCWTRIKAYCMALNCKKYLCGEL